MSYFKLPARLVYILFLIWKGRVLYVLQGWMRCIECCGTKAKESEKRKEYISDGIQQALQGERR